MQGNVVPCGMKLHKEHLQLLLHRLYNCIMMNIPLVHEVSQLHDMSKAIYLHGCFTVVIA